MKRAISILLFLIVLCTMCACTPKPEPVQVTPSFLERAEAIVCYVGPDSNKETACIVHDLNGTYRFVSPAFYDKLYGKMAAERFSLNEADVGKWDSGQVRGFYLASEASDEVKAAIAFVPRAQYDIFCESDGTDEKQPWSTAGEHTSQTAMKYHVYEQPYDRLFVADFGAELYVVTVWIPKGDGNTDVLDHLKFEVRRVTEP